MKPDLSERTGSNASEPLSDSFLNRGHWWCNLRILHSGWSHNSSVVHKNPSPILRPVRPTIRIWEDCESASMVITSPSPVARDTSRPVAVPWQRRNVSTWTSSADRPEPFIVHVPVPFCTRSDYTVGRTGAYGRGARNAPGGTSNPIPPISTRWNPGDSVKGISPLPRSALGSGTLLSNPVGRSRPGCRA